MAGEEKRYTDWVRQQPCAACETRLRIEPHHSLYGTTYSPEGTKPAKSIEGARKGMAQRSHDYFALPLCMKCHIPGIHKLGGFFAGWSRDEANAWEAKQVGIHRRRYAMQAPVPVPMPTATSSRTARKRTLGSWTVPTVVDLMRKEARHRPADVSAAFTELADLIEHGKNL